MLLLLWLLLGEGVEGQLVQHRGFALDIEGLLLVFVRGLARSVAHVVKEVIKCEEATLRGISCISDLGLRLALEHLSDLFIVPNCSCMGCPALLVRLLLFIHLI